MAVKHPGQESNPDLLRAIVDEVDEAREVHELAQQLAHALPLKSFDEIGKALGSQGMITFRGVPYKAADFVDVVPSVLFPIDSVEKLVTLLAATVRLAPRTLRRGPDDAHQRAKLRRLGLLGLGPIGVLGRPRRSAPPAHERDRAHDGKAS
jgi:hypothetical protein